MSATTTAICVIVMGTGGGTMRPPVLLTIGTSSERAWAITATVTEACAATDDGGKARPEIWSPRGSGQRSGRARARSGRTRARAEPAFQLEQAERNQLVGDQNVEESAMQGAEDRLRLVQAPGDADDLGDAGQIGQLDPDPAVMDRQGDDVAVGVEELAEDVAHDAVLAQVADVVRRQVSHLHDGGVGAMGAQAHKRPLHGPHLV